MATIHYPQDSHGHSHHHEHGHEHGHHHHHLYDLQHMGDSNAAHFDKEIASPETVTESSWLRMYDLFSKELVEQRTWFGLPTALKDRAGSSENNNSSSNDSSTSSPSRPIRMLDYACGGGHASRTLLPYVDEVVGVDVSGKSIEGYNAWAASNGVSAVAMRGVQGNIMTDGGAAALAGPEFHGFDLAVCIMALHHVSDPALLVERLVQRLRPGGTLLVIEWNQDGCTLFPPAAAKKPGFVGHVVGGDNGFGSDRMRAYMHAAGCDDFAYKELTGYTEAGVSAMSRARKTGVDEIA